MAHKEQRFFVELASIHFPEYFARARVLEVGSLDINGSARDFFDSSCQYIGIDVAPGKAVDVVCQGQDYRSDEGEFDCVLSCEAMEHNPSWKATMANMLEVCRPGGLVVMTCATTGRREHGTRRTSPSSSPLTVELGWDYYRNLTASNIRGAVAVRSAFMVHGFWRNWRSFDLYLCGIKSSGPKQPELLARWAGFEAAVNAALSRENSSRTCRYRALVAPLLGDRWFHTMRAVTEKLSRLHDGE